MESQAGSHYLRGAQLGTEREAVASADVVVVFRLVGVAS